MLTASEFQRVARETTAELGFTDDYESEQVQHFYDIVRGAKRFIDVGANRGLYGKLATRMMQGGQIALIEANPMLAERLGKSLVGWPDSNANQIEVFATAAGDRSSGVPFFLDLTDTLGSCIKTSWEVNPTKSINVPIQALDDLFPPEPGTVIKIDVEGFEYHVLQGAKRLLGVDDIRLVVELHGWGDPENRKYPLQVLWMMTLNGFAMSRVGVSHSYGFVRADWQHCLVSFLRWAPVFTVKHVVDRAGMRAKAYRLLTAPVLRRVWPEVARRAAYRHAELKGEILRTGGLSRIPRFRG